MTIWIYGIINKVNNLIYIGESNNIERRWEEHIDDLNNNSHCNYKLQTAWNTYGKDNFKFEILEEIEKIKGSPYKTTMQLIYVEGKYIGQYNSINNGYNIENTVEEVLSGRKVITSGSIDKKYLYRLVNKIVKRQSLTSTYIKLSKEYNLKFANKQLLLKGVIIKTDNYYYIKDEFIEKGYFVNGKLKKKYGNDEGFRYHVSVTEEGEQFIIDILELKKKK